MEQERISSQSTRGALNALAYIRGDSALAQFIRYGMSGGVVYALDIASFLALYWGAGLGPQLANFSAKIIGATVGFVLHRHFTYAGDHRDRVSQQAARYTALLAFNIGLSALLVFLFVDLIAAPVVPFRILADVIVIVNSYLCMRFIVFRAASRGDGGDK